MEGLLSDVANTINCRRAGLTRGGYPPVKRPSRISDQQVADMRHRYTDKWETVASFAPEYGVSQSYALELIRGPRGRHSAAI